MAGYMKERAPLTLALTALNVIAYLALTSRSGGLGTLVNGASTEALLRAGALYGPYVLEGAWWRLGTGAFLHAGLIHLTLNMLALRQVGRAYEGLAGHARFAAVYTLALLGGAFSVLFFNFDEPTVGASGAVFGLFGALLAIGLRLGAAGRAIVKQTAPIVAINLVFGFTANSVGGGNLISNAGHLGGLLAGFLAALLLGVPRRTTEALRALHASSQETAPVPPSA